MRPQSYLKATSKPGRVGGIGLRPIGWCQNILEKYCEAAQGWRRKAEQMVFARNRTSGPCSRRRRDEEAFHEASAWKPFPACSLFAARRSSIGTLCLPWLALLVIGLAVAASAAELYVRQSGWVETMLASRTALDGAGLSGSGRTKAAEQLWFRVKDDFPVQWDWALQDGGAEFARWFHSADAASMEQRLVEKAVAELGEPGRGLRQELDRLALAGAPAKDRRRLDLYIKACE